MPHNICISVGANSVPPKAGETSAIRPYDCSSRKNSKIREIPSSVQSVVQTKKGRNADKSDSADYTESIQKNPLFGIWNPERLALKTAFSFLIANQEEERSKIREIPSSVQSVMQTNGLLFKNCLAVGVENFLPLETGKTTINLYQDQF
jgi:hypothetical protein